MTISSVAVPNQAYDSMLADWMLIDALRGGTRAMRQLGELYLPKRTMEAFQDYARRLCLATLFPAFITTTKAMVGRVFAEPMVINDDVPGWIKDEVLNDVDREGRNLHVFVREWFEEALEYGLSHVLVESPETQNVKTRADQAAAGIRPYLIRIHPRDVLGWRFTDGKLTQLRVRFTREVESEEFGVEYITEIRVYELDGVRVFIEEKDGAGNGTGNYQEQLPPIPTNWDAIPFVTLYTQRTGLMRATPPMRELAFLNAKHWRMQSSSDELIETAQVPILLMTGVNEGDQIVIGANNAVRLSTHDANLKYVEHTGKAIDAGRSALADLVEEMRQIGAKMLKPDNKTSRTATQVSDEAARDNSMLGAMVLQLQDTVNATLDVIASWRGEAKGGTVTLQPNLDPDLDPNTTIASILSLEQARIVSPQTVFGQAQAMGIIPDDLDWEEEQVRIQEQAPPMPTTAFGGDPNNPNPSGNPNPVNDPNQRQPKAA